MHHQRDSLSLSLSLSVASLSPPPANSIRIHWLQFAGFEQVMRNFVWKRQSVDID